MNEPGGRILIADDEAELTRAFARILAAEGYDAVRCHDGGEALSRLAAEHFDAILSDITMPGLNGIELLREVRSHDRDLPVILVTGGPQLDTAILAVEYGAFKYLTKPVASDDLVKTVRRAVRMYRLATLKREALSLAGGSLGEASDKAGLEASFDRALHSLWPAFQPIVNVEDRSLYAYEALLRTDERSLPHPGAVLDAAERLEKIHEVGRTMRERSVRPLMAMSTSYDLFLNLHPLDLVDPMLLAPEAPHMAVADRIVLEITERASLDGIPDAASTIKALREAGFRIAVDDLGAGYAGLASFVQLEPDLVKLDMSLTRGVDQSATRQRLVRSMTQVCSDMGMLVVAEGVETVGERDALAELGCDLLQGYLFGRPDRNLVEPHWP